MNYLKKLISLCVILVLTVGLVGCGGKGPSQAVSDALDSIKKGEDKSFSTIFSSQISKKDDDAANEAVNRMLDTVKNITYKVNSEKKDGDTATVNVTVNGPDFEDILSQFMQKVMEEAEAEQLSGETLSDKELDAKLLEILSGVLENVKSTERTMDIDLVRENNEWAIKDEMQLVKLATNIDSDTINKIIK